MNKKKIKLLGICIIALAIISCGHEKNNVGNYDEALSLKKIVSKKSLSTAKVSEIFNDNSDIQADKDVRDLGLKAATLFEPKNLLKPTCTLLGIIQKEKKSDGLMKDCEKVVSTCIEYAEKHVDWDNLKLTSEKALEALEQCDSMTIGDMADCFVLLNEVNMAMHESLSCELGSVREAENLILKNLELKSQDLNSQLEECSNALVLCHIKPEINFESDNRSPKNILKTE